MSRRRLSDAEFQMRKRAVEVQLDRWLDRYGNPQRVEELRRRRVRTFILSAICWVAWFSLDAMVTFQAGGASLQTIPPGSASSSAAALQDWWPQISTVLVALVAIVTLRASFTAHKQYVEAQLLLKADKGEVTAQLAAIKESLQALRESTREGFRDARGEVSELRKDVQQMTRRQHNPRADAS